MRISLTKSAENGNPGQIMIDVKVSTDDDPKAELVHSHSFDLQPLKEKQAIVTEIFSTKPKLKSLRDHGKRLSRALFSGDESKRVFELLQERLPNDRILLELNGAEELDIIPWEYAWTGQNYLVYQCILIRMHKPKEFHLPKLPLRIVVVTPDPIIPPDDPDADILPELHLNDQFQNFIDGHYRNEKEVILERVVPPTVDRMNEVLLNQSDTATALHFMGHCGEKDVDRTLIFEDKETGKPDFADTRRFSNMPKNLRLAFLCACNTRNVALALVQYGGVPYTIGSHCSIPDNIARKFESTFYQLLAGGCSVEVAMLRARVSLMDHANSGQYDYFSGAMMLYSSTFRSDDGAFECKEGKLNVKAHTPRNNLKDIATASIFHGRKKELFELNLVLRRMANRGEQSCRVYTIAGSGAKGKSALAVEAMRRSAHLFPGGVFVWPFDYEKISLAKYFRRLVECIFPDDIQALLRNQINDGDVRKLGLDILNQFVGYPTSLLILDHANTLKEAEAQRDEEAIALGKWLRQIASASDISVKILVTSDSPLEWTDEQTYYLDDLILSDTESMGQRESIAKTKVITNDTKTMTTRTASLDNHKEAEHPQVHDSNEFVERKGYNIASQNHQTNEPVTKRFYAVPAENQAFVNRPIILEKIETALRGTPSSDGCRILALKGLGGMGKTQLMLRYSYLNRARYDSIFWLKVDSWVVAVDSFRKLAIDLGIDEKSTQGKDSEDKIIQWVRTWFEARTNWLLLLDNADNDDMDKKIFNLLPHIGGHIIFTTRVNIPSNKATVIPIEKMQQDEAILLLLGKPLDVDQESTTFHQIQEIVTLLDCTPLAVNLARAYVENNGINHKQYLSKLKTKHGILFQYRDVDNSDVYSYSIETVWQLSLERVRAQSPIAAQIIETCTFLRPENIPTRLFLQQSSILELVSTSSVSPASDQDNEPILEALRVLIKYSFLTRTCAEDGMDENDPAADLLTMHRLVQKVVYDAMTNEQKLHWVHKISNALNQEAYFSRRDSHEPNVQKTMNVYLPHIHHFVSLFEELDLKLVVSDKLEKLLTRSVHYLLSREIYSGIEELAQISVKVSKSMPGSDQRRIMAAINNLAVVYETLGKYKEVEPLHQQALAICEEAFGLEHPYTAIILNNLALLYKIQAEFDKAEPLYERALAIREKIGGAELATSLNNLAMLYSSQGKYDKAKVLLQRALEIREKALGPEHPETAESLNNLAGVYNDQGQYKECEPLYKRVLEIREKVLGPEKVSTAMALNNLAKLYRSLGKYNDAAPLHQRALDICEKVLGPEHRDTAVSLNSLAELCESQGKYDEAQQLYERALGIREKVLGSEHPNTAESLSNLARLYDSQGKYTEAEELQKRALAICEKILGAEHPATAESLNNLAVIYTNQNMNGKAEPLYQRALTIREKALGLEHPDTATTLNNLALLYINQSKFDKAGSMSQQALTIREKAFGSEHPDVATSLNTLALLYQKQGKFDQSKPLYERALEIREKALGVKHPSTATSRDNLAAFSKSQETSDNERFEEKRRNRSRDASPTPKMSKFACFREQYYYVYGHEHEY